MIANEYPNRLVLQQMHLSTILMTSKTLVPPLLTPIQQHCQQHHWPDSYPFTLWTVLANFHNSSSITFSPCALILPLLASQPCLSISPTRIEATLPHLRGIVDHVPDFSQCGKQRTQLPPPPYKYQNSRCVQKELSSLIRIFLLKKKLSLERSLNSLFVCLFLLSLHWQSQAKPGSS